MTGTHISITLFYEIVDLVLGNQQKKLTAVDIITVRYGFENFMDMKDMFVELQQFCTAIEDEVFNKVSHEIEEVETFLKTEFKSHLCSQTIHI